MRILIKLAGGIAMAAFAANAAMAADAIETPPEPPMAAPVQITTPSANWSGIYVGAFGGYNWNDLDGNTANVDGWSGGGFAGYNFQSGSTVFGVEGDVGYSGAEGTDGNYTAKQGTFGSVRGRLGYAFDPFMLYGTGGLALSHAELSDGVNSDSNTHVGWTVGAGAEAALTDNIFGRLEYRYSDYGSKDYTLGASTVSSGFSTQSVNAGIGFKF